MRPLPHKGVLKLSGHTRIPNAGYYARRFRKKIFSVLRQNSRRKYEKRSQVGFFFFFVLQVLSTHMTDFSPLVKDFGACGEKMEA